MRANRSYQAGHDLHLHTEFPSLINERTTATSVSTGDKEDFIARWIKKRTRTNSGFLGAPDVEARDHVTDLDTSLDLRRRHCHRPSSARTERTVRPITRKSSTRLWWRRYQNSYCSFSRASPSAAP